MTIYGKVRMGVAVLFVAFAAYGASQSTNSHPAISHDVSQLNAMRVAINNVNHSLLPNHFEMQGDSVRYINGHQVALLNGKLRASRESIRQGLDSAYLASETNVSALRGWKVIEMQSDKQHSRSVQIFAHAAPDNCFLVYTEAGTSSQARAAKLDVIDHGCK